MKTKTLLFWLVVGAQAVFLLGWAGWHEQARSRGQVVLLKTRPVDPQDLLRGDYMILGYEIADVRLPMAEGSGLELGSECWVVLEPRDNYYRVVYASMTEPQVGPGMIAVLARYGRRGMEYGIENYYVPEGKGTPSFKKIEVEAAVGANHHLYIKRVLLDGKSYP